MNKALFLISMIFFSYPAFCQENDTLNVYKISLTEHLTYLKSLSKRNLHSVYVERNEITEGLPTKIDGIDIVYLSGREIRDKTRKGKSVDLMVIKPVKVNKKSLKVSIIDFSVTTGKKNILNYSNGGGSGLVFTYNCELQVFELTYKKHGGI